MQLSLVVTRCRDLTCRKTTQSFSNLVPAGVIERAGNFLIRLHFGVHEYSYCVIRLGWHT